MIAGLAAQCAPMAACAGALSGRVQLVSDYLYRGVSISDGGPAIQGEVDADLGHGVSAEVFVSRATQAVEDNEVDCSLGKTMRFGAISTSVGVSHYSYASGRRNYWELPASIAVEAGRWTIGLDAALAPAQAAIGAVPDAYVAVNVTSRPLYYGVSVSASVGYQSSAWTRGADWAINARRAFGPAYVGVGACGVRTGARIFAVTGVEF